MGVCTFEFCRSLCRQWQFLRFLACLYGLLKTFVPFSTSELRSALQLRVRILRMRSKKGSSSSIIIFTNERTEVCTQLVFFADWKVNWWGGLLVVFSWRKQIYSSPTFSHEKHIERDKKNEWHCWLVESQLNGIKILRNHKCESQRNWAESQLNAIVVERDG